MKSLFSIVKAPLVTEKSTRDSVSRKYTFLVDKSANKVEIKQALESIYKIKVEKISSMVVKGKMKRIRNNQAGLTMDWKKAIVTLKPGHEIKLT
jgi:large subunit ribosomal protein L23